jgi:hypothetical protein
VFVLFEYHGTRSTIAFDRTFVCIIRDSSDV